MLSDTRSIYTPLFSGVLWDVQNYLLEDIERVEVIRGPSIGATPRILIQRRPDEDTYCVTVQEAWDLWHKEGSILKDKVCDHTFKRPRCWWCALYDELQGLA